MQVLPNGQIKIKNNLSGEERIINPDEMAKYKISPDAYNAAKTATQSTVFTPSGNYQNDIVKYGAEPSTRGQIDAYYNHRKRSTGNNKYEIDSLERE